VEICGTSCRRCDPLIKIRNPIACLLVNVSQRQKELSLIGGVPPMPTMRIHYAISDSLFHWQSQSTTSAEAPVGKRYIEHRERGSTVMLFVRQEKRRNSLASPYSFLGPADYVSHQGSRPMNIIWKLRHPMPAKFLQKAARLLNE
jgi:Domain of unknown function (DUF3427)